MLVEFEEALHPRAGKGSPTGGQFVSKGGTSAGPSKWQALASKPVASGLLSLFKIPSGYRQFHSKNEVGDYGEQHYAAYKSLQLESIFATISPNRIRAALIEGDKTRTWSQYEDTWEAIDTLDAVMEESIIPESLVVHRVLDPAMVQSFDEMVVGDKATMVSFTHAELAPPFANIKMIKLLVDAGQPGLILDQEVVLPRAGEMQLLGRDADGLIFKWLGANPEKITAQQLQKEKDAETLNFLNSTFPNLREVHKDADPNSKYNCYSWAVGDDTKWWGPGLYWPLPLSHRGQDAVEDFDELFVDIFHAKELTPDPKNQEYEKGFVKLALFTVDELQTGEATPTHLARLLPSGQWQSKIGQSVLVQHGTDVRDMNGGAYGDVSKIYKLREEDWKDIKDYKPDNITLAKHNARAGLDTERETLNREAAYIRSTRYDSTETVGKVTGKVIFANKDEGYDSLVRTRMQPAIRMLGERSGEKYKENTIYIGHRGQWHSHVATANIIRGGDTDYHHDDGEATYERGFFDPTTKTYYVAKEIGVDAAELRNPVGDRISESRVDDIAAREFEKETEAKTRSVAKQVANDLDFNTKHLKFRTPTQAERKRAVGSRMGRLDGVYNPITGDVTVILGHSDPWSGGTQGTVAHEIQHSRFYKVYDAYLDRQMVAYGLVEDKGLDDEAFAAVAPYFKKDNEKHKALVKEDGVTKYSESFWTKKSLKAEGSPQKAINETLAEIARLEYQKKYPISETGPKFSDVSKVWLDLYREVNKQYKRLNR